MRTPGRVLLMVLAAGAAAADPPSEGEILEYLTQARFQDASALVEKFPPDSPVRAAAAGPAGRLAGLQARLIEAVNAGNVAVDVKAIHPGALRDGTVVGATATHLKVQGESGVVRLLWAGLPPRATLELARRTLAAEAAADAALLPDLAEALGLADELRTLDPARADAVAATAEIREALATNAVEEARKRLDGLPKGAREGPWLALARSWVERLEKEMDRGGKDDGVPPLLVPAGAETVMMEDFEGTSGAAPSRWHRGLTGPPPDGVTKRNRWCRRTVFAGKTEHWGEMIDVCSGFPENPDPAVPEPLLRTGLTLACRIWPVNVRELVLVLHSRAKDQSRAAEVLVPLPRMDGWTAIRVRLDDAMAYRPLYRGDAPAFPQIGDPMLSIEFTARRADPARNDGCLYIDDVRLYRLPPDREEPLR